MLYLGIAALSGLAMGFKLILAKRLQEKEHGAVTVSTISKPKSTIPKPKVSIISKVSEAFKSVIGEGKNEVIVVHMDPEKAKRIFNVIEDQLRTAKPLTEAEMIEIEKPVMTAWRAATLKRLGLKVG